MRFLDIFSATVLSCTTIKCYCILQKKRIRSNDCRDSLKKGPLSLFSTKSKAWLWRKVKWRKKLNKETLCAQFLWKKETSRVLPCRWSISLLRSLKNWSELRVPNYVYSRPKKAWLCWKENFSTHISSWRTEVKFFSSIY